MTWRGCLDDTQMPIMLRAMDHAEFMRAHAKKLDPKVANTRFEKMFAENVLSRLRVTLDFSNLQLQRPFKDAAGRSRRIDFALVEDGGVRIAIEVDGFDKTSSGTGMTYQEFTDWLFRETSLVSQGWRVLRFANGMVSRDAQGCARLVDLTIEQARVEAEHRDVQRLRGELAAVQSELEAERTKDVVLRGDDFAASFGMSEEEARELLEESDRLIRSLTEQVREYEANVREAEALAGDPRLVMSPEMKGLENERESDLRSLALQLTEKTEEIDKMKRLATVFAVVVVALVLGGLGLAYLVSDRSGDEATSCEGTLTPTDARGCLGESVTVEGVVANSGNSGSTVYLNLGAPYPDPNRFVIVVSDSTEAWGKGKEGESVQAAGEVAYVDEGIAGIEVISESAVRP